MKDLRVPLEQRHEFDDIIDARTPLEFAEDHLPGAINAPVLSNEERVVIGTLYREAPFEATRLGAAMVARNIARHLDTLFADRPRQWKPLIYCWRGGKRSGSMTTWFDLIGWRARQLEGGYKTYRRWVLDTLAVQPAAFRYIVLTGHTGSGKTRLLQALAEAGAQTLDLEDLAAHRGSLLGALPGRAQPSQKGFDTALVNAFARFDPAQPVFVEAESRKIGNITLPDVLLHGMHGGDCVAVHVERASRIAFLLQDYHHLFDAPDAFKGQLARLVGLHSKDTIAHWHALIDQGARAALFDELIDQHYDPAYSRSSHAHFSARDAALPFQFEPNAPDSVTQAQALLAALHYPAVPG
ncbi:MAG: tRNA 2-selenouridine(34) synthase MnmH [Janthinobacterium lividum]